MPKVAASPVAEEATPDVVAVPTDAEKTEATNQDAQDDAARDTAPEVTETTEESDPAEAPEEVAKPVPAKKATPRKAPAKKAAPKVEAPAVEEDGFESLTDEEDFTKALFYGREGQGKTTAFAQASHRGKVLVINAEGGMKKRALLDQGVNIDNIVSWPKKGQPITARSLEKLHEKVLTDLQADPKSWYLVSMDSISEVLHVLREQATDKRVGKSRVEVDPDFVDRDDYGVMTNQLRKIIRRFRDLPCHVVFTALEKEDEEKGTVGPAITPALAVDLLGYVDIVLRFGSPDESFRARSQATAKIRAKDRYGVLPAVIAEPDFLRIEDFLTGVIDADTDQLQIEMNASEVERLAAIEKAKEEAAARKAAARKTPTKKAAPAADTEENN